MILFISPEIHNNDADIHISIHRSLLRSIVIFPYRSTIAKLFCYMVSSYAFFFGAVLGITSNGQSNWISGISYRAHWVHEVDNIDIETLFIRAICVPIS